MNVSARYYSSFLKFIFSALKKGMWGICVPVAILGAETTISKQDQLHLIRLKQIGLLERFIQKYPGNSNLPESHFRLAEASFEAAKYFQLRNDRIQQKHFLEKAETSLEQLRHQFHHYERLDEALFLLGNIYLEKKEMDKAGAVFADIAKRFPKSPVLKDAALLLGDYYFEKQKWVDSRRFYELASSDPKLVSYVQYKLAWVALNEQRPSLALKHFETVIQLGNSGSQENYSLEAAREIVWPALEVYSSLGVMAYLEKTLGSADLIQKTFSAFAEALLKRENHELSSQIYDVLWERYSQGTFSEDWALNQLRSEIALKRNNKLSVILQRASASPKILEQLLKAAQKFHAEAQRETKESEKQKNYDLAITYYQVFLEKAPVTGEYSRHAFYLGEALYARQRYKEALEAYRRAANTPSGVQAQAAWNMFLTAEKLATGFSYQGKDVGVLSLQDEDYLKIAQFLQTISGISEAQKRKARYQQGRLLYQLNHWDEALEVFLALAENEAQSEEGKLSAQLVLDIYNLKSDYQKVAEHAQKYRKTTLASRQTELSSLEEKASLKTIAEVEKKAKQKEGHARIMALKEVGEKYIQFSEKYPHSLLVPEALWAAFLTFEEVAYSNREFFSSFEDLFHRLAQNKKYQAKVIERMGNFLASQSFSPETLQAFRPFRNQWYGAMKEKTKRGALGLLVYQLSTESEKKELQREFAQLPFSEENRALYALGKLPHVQSLKTNLFKVTLNDLKTLTKNTEKKMALLEGLEAAAAQVVKLKVAEPAVEALKILAESYHHMADSFQNSPRPSQLEGDTLKQYEEAVATKVHGLQKKAKETEQLAKEKAEEFNLQST